MKAILVLLVLVACVATPGESTTSQSAPLEEAACCETLAGDEHIVNLGTQPHNDFDPGAGDIEARANWMTVIPATTGHPMNDNVLSLGINFQGNGAPIDPLKPAIGLQLESYWDYGTGPVSEWHLKFRAPGLSSLTYFILSGIANWNDSRLLSGISGNFQFFNDARTELVAQLYNGYLYAGQKAPPWSGQWWFSVGPSGWAFNNKLQSPSPSIDTTGMTCDEKVDSLIAALRTKGILAD